MLAAVLLMQAAAELPMFDLAALPGGTAEPAVAEAVDLVVGPTDGRCGSDRADPFQPDAIVICAPTSRVSYRIPVATSTALDDPPPAVERLADRSRCGVTANPVGCFQGVTVLRATAAGTTVLPDSPRP